MYGGNAAAIRTMIKHLIKLTRWYRSQGLIDCSTSKGFEKVVAREDSNKTPNTSFSSGNFTSVSSM